MNTTLNVRGIDSSAARAIKRAAAGRGLTIGQYLHRLALLHTAMLEMAQEEPRISAQLALLDLDPAAEALTMPPRSAREKGE